MTKLFNISTEVHRGYGTYYRVKASLPDLGVYINGILVYPPNEDHKNWGVIPPSRPAGRGKFANIVEFNKKLPLWSEIYEACVDAVKCDPEYTQRQIREDVALEDIDDTPIDFSEIPF